MRSGTRIDLTTVTSTFVPFGLLLSAALLAAERTQAPTRYRLVYAAWVSMALAAPALCLYALPARSAARRGYWLLFWTFSYVAYLVHFFYAFVVTYHASLGELYTHQRVLIATSNLIVTMLWGLDVVLGWVATRDTRTVGIIRGAAHALVFVTFFVSSVVIFRGPGRVLGIAMTAAVAVSLVVRLAMRLWARDPRPSERPAEPVRERPLRSDFPARGGWRSASGVGPSVPVRITPVGGVERAAAAIAKRTSREPATYSPVPTPAGGVAPRPANLRPTRIVDADAEEVRMLADRLAMQSTTERSFVQRAHGYLAAEMRAIYSIDDEQPASETLRVNGGSCSQRMAVLEALARAEGIPTRVRALWLKREFWNSRPPLLRYAMPRRTLMPWPQFFIEGAWVDLSELYGSIGELAARATKPLTNRAESLFTAVESTPVDFWGKSAAIAGGRFDLRHFVAGEGALFDTRDELLEMAGTQTKWLGRTIFAVLYGGRPIRRADG